MREIAIKFHTNPEAFPNLSRICLPADWENLFHDVFLSSSRLTAGGPFGSRSLVLQFGSGNHFHEFE